MLPSNAPRFDLERVATLAPAERKVIEYLLDAGPADLMLSAAALGEKIGTSDVTVVRAAKSLGYSLSGLRQALAVFSSEAQPRERLDRTLDETRGDYLLTDNIAKWSRGLDSLVRHVPPEFFDQAVKTLAESDRIVWRGVGPSGCLAEYAQIHCQRFGHPSTSMTQSGTALADELLSLAKKDALVVFSYGRVQQHVLVVLDQAKEIGCSVVLITDQVDKKLVGRVDLVLECGRGEPQRFASHAVTLVLVESLLLGVAERQRDRADKSLEKLNELRAALAGRNMDVDSH